MLSHPRWAKPVLGTQCVSSTHWSNHCPKEEDCCPHIPYLPCSAPLQLVGRKPIEKLGRKLQDTTSKDGIGCGHRQGGLQILQTLLWGAVPPLEATCHSWVYLLFPLSKYPRICQLQCGELSHLPIHSFSECLVMCQAHTGDKRW